MRRLLSRWADFLSVRRLRAEVMLVIVMSAIAFAWNFLCFVALYRYAGVNVLAAKVSGTFVGFGFNYFVRQFFIFSRIPLHKPYRLSCSCVSALSWARPRQCVIG